MRQSSQGELASHNDFLLYESPKKKLNSTIKSTGVSPGNIHGVAQHSHASNAKGKLKKVLMCTRRTFVLHMFQIYEIEIPPPIYDRDTKNKAEELPAMKEKLATASNTDKLHILTLVPDSWS